MLMCPLNAPAASGFYVGRTQWHVLSAAAVQTSTRGMSPRGQARALTAPTRPFLDLSTICNVNATGREMKAALHVE